MHVKASLYLFSIFFESWSVNQGGVQWRNLGSFNLHLPGSSNSSASASQVAHHHTQLMFVFFVEMGFHHIGQPGLELPTSSDPPVSVSQSAGIPSWPGPSYTFLTHAPFEGTECRDST